MLLCMNMHGILGFVITAYGSFYYSDQSNSNLLLHKKLIAMHILSVYKCQVLFKIVRMHPNEHKLEFHLYFYIENN